MRVRAVLYNPFPVGTQLFRWASTSSRVVKVTADDNWSRSLLRGGETLTDALTVDWLAHLAVRRALQQRLASELSPDGDAAQTPRCTCGRSRAHDPTGAACARRDTASGEGGADATLADVLFSRATIARKLSSKSIILSDAVDSYYCTHAAYISARRDRRASISLLFSVCEFFLNSAPCIRNLPATSQLTFFPAIQSLKDFQVFLMISFSLLKYFHSTIRYALTPSTWNTAQP